MNLLWLSKNLYNSTVSLKTPFFLYVFLVVLQFFCLLLQRVSMNLVNAGAIRVDGLYYFKYNIMLPATSLMGVVGFLATSSWSLSFVVCLRWILASHLWNCHFRIRNDIFFAMYTARSAPTCVWLLMVGHEQSASAFIKKWETHCSQPLVIKN